MPESWRRPTRSGGAIERDLHDGAQQRLVALRIKLELAEEALRNDPEALRAAALRAPLAASVSSDGISRYAPEVESAVYFCCLEALQNAAKHAAGATRVTISLSEDDRLRFEVRDDGAGLAAGSPRGAGLTNMRDRVTALGGDLEVASAAGTGAVVKGSIPVRS